MSCEWRGFSRHRFRYDLMRFRCPDDKGAGPFMGASGESPGDVMEEMARPRPTICAVLDEDAGPPEGCACAVVERSDTQYLMRCTEFSKLLMKGERDAV